MSTDKVKIYNTLNKQVEDFKVIEEGKAQVYCCGPTVYDYQHIGNFRTFIFEDILTKTLSLAKFDVEHVMNITDVGHLTGDNDEGEDKMLVAMRREGKTSLDIAKFYTDKFFEDWDKLGLKRPGTVCNATDHIQEMIELIKRIEDNGYAYFANGNVYFDVEKFEKYGDLANLNLDDLRAGARIQIDQNKKNPFDFVLWFTKSKFEDQELQWDSPWGRGYPGWHIECSAMSMKYLGDHFDIHCGGIDHVPVHHTNEIAQSEAASGKKWVNYWMHSEFILLNSDKMSKSKGGFIVLDDLVNEGIQPLAYRLFCLSAHYRQQLNFTWDAVKQSEVALKRIFKIVLELKSTTNESELNDEVLELCAPFKEALFNDLNTPKAMAAFWDILKNKGAKDEVKLAAIYFCDQVLSLGLKEFTEVKTEVPAEVMELVTKRQEAKASKNYKEADKLRDEITALGYKVVDSKDGAKVEKI